MTRNYTVNYQTPQDSTPQIWQGSAESTDRAFDQFYKSLGGNTRNISIQSALEDDKELDLKKIEQMRLVNS